MTERARIDGIDIPEERFAELFTEMMPAIERCVAGEGRPSYYESLLALAFLYFARERVDIAVIEVGLGGTLDGTNVIVPQVAAITTVGYDHTEILGDTLELIAADKSGIAKPGIPLVCGVTDPGARAVIEARCAEVGAPFVPVWETTTIELGAGERYAQHFAVTTPSGRYDVALPLLGAFQRTNAAIALRVVEQLRPDLRPSREACERGLATATLAGRMEFFPSHPGVVFDVAHNPEKAARLADSLREQFPDRHFWMIIAIGTSKDAGEIVRALGTLPATFVFTSFDAAGRTAIEPQRLASIAEGRLVGRAIADPVEALTSRGATRTPTTSWSSPARPDRRGAAGMVVRTCRGRHLGAARSRCADALAVGRAHRDGHRQRHPIRSPATAWRRGALTRASRRSEQQRSWMSAASRPPGHEARRRTTDNRVAPAIRALRERLPRHRLGHTYGQRSRAACGGEPMIDSSGGMRGLLDVALEFGRRS